MSDSTTPENGAPEPTSEEVDEQGPKETDWGKEARKWESRAKASKAEADANREAAKRLAELEEASKTAEQKQMERSDGLLLILVQSKDLVGGVAPSGPRPDSGRRLAMWRQGTRTGLGFGFE